MPDQLTSEQRQQLQQAERAALVTIVADADAYGPKAALELWQAQLADPDYDPALARALAAFLTLCVKGKLKPETWTACFDEFVADTACIFNKEGLSEELRAEFRRKSN